MPPPIIRAMGWIDPPPELANGRVELLITVAAGSGLRRIQRGLARLGAAQFVSIVVSRSAH